MNPHFAHRFAVLLLLAAIAVLPPARPFADEPASRVVAKVDGVPITDADVDREIAIAFPNSNVDPNAKAAVRKQTTEQLIRRQLVLRYLRETDQAASSTDVDLAIARLKKQLAQREESFEDYLKSKKLDEASLRQSLTWQIGWRRLLSKHLTDANLQNYFDKHRREFDGTEIHVAHVLFPVDANSEPAARSAAQQKAKEVLSQVKSGTLAFADAAKRYSSSPSRDEGGDIGWIGRHEPMPEPFSRAAFALEINQVSEPVETTFGWHLIRCLETKPGQKRWTDVRGELELAATEYLFNWVADQVRTKAKID